MDTDLIILLCAVAAGLVYFLLRMGAKRARTCEVCKGPRDPNSPAPGVWEYGVLACDACGAKLHQRFKDEPHPPYPPYPPA